MPCSLSPSDPPRDTVPDLARDAIPNERCLLAFWGIIPESFNAGGPIPAFPSLPTEALPAQPVDLQMTPDGTKWWIAGKEGEIVEVCVSDYAFVVRRQIYVVPP